MTYVSNIYKYYVAYRLVVEEGERRAALKATVKGQDAKNIGKLLLNLLQ